MASHTDDTGWRGKFGRFWRRSFTGDYVGLALLLGGNIWVAANVEPFHRMFSLDDRSLTYPHALVERVSSRANIGCAGALPLVVLVLWLIVQRPGIHQSQATILGFFIGLISTELLTDIIKNAVGRPRPDLIARCKPVLGAPAHELVTIDVCTETDHHTLHDGWRSFPSGHSSLAFAGLGYLAIFMAGQLAIFRPRTNLIFCLMCVVPLIGAAFIAISRLEDYRHDVYDVSAGSLLGTTLAFISYRRYYRAPWHRKCGTLTANTSARSRHAKFTRLDEEQNATDVTEFETGSTDDECSERL